MPERFTRHRVGTLPSDIRDRCRCIPGSDLIRWLDRAGPDWIVLWPTGPETFLCSSVIVARTPGSGEMTVRLGFTFHQLGGVVHAHGEVGRSKAAGTVGALGLEWLRDPAAPSLNQLGRILVAGIDTYDGVRAVLDGAEIDWVLGWESTQTD